MHLMEQQNINTLIMTKQSYDLLSDKTKKELDTHAIQILIVDIKDPDYSANHDRVNMLAYFRRMWEIINTSSINRSASNDLSKLKQSIATIKGALG